MPGLASALCRQYVVGAGYALPGGCGTGLLCLASDHWAGTIVVDDGIAWLVPLIANVTELGIVDDEQAWLLRRQLMASTTEIRSRVHNEFRAALLVFG